MSHQGDFSLDDVIAEYLQALDDGETPNPVEFVTRWPVHREAFLRFVNHASRMKGLASKSIDDLASEIGVPKSSRSVNSVFGGYQIKRLIGRGGMSCVYRAQNLVDGSFAALKVLDATRISDSTLQKRFQREAQAAQSLDHPNIVPLLTYGTDDGVPYLVFPLIEGCTLAELIAAFRARGLSRGADADSPLENESPRDGSAGTTQGSDSVRQQGGRQPDGSGQVGAADDLAAEPSLRLALDCFGAKVADDGAYRRIAEIIAVAADALHAAHQQGIIHRDVKPSNLMIDETGHVWLTDFGLASVSDAQSVLTHTGQVLGTPQYMSPEQSSFARDQIVDHRSDLFSLGATLYELATHQKPYRFDGVRGLPRRSHADLLMPSRIRADFPKPLEAIILKAMSVSPADRYSTGAEMAMDLQRFVAGRETLARLPGPTDVAVRWLVGNPRKSISVALGLVAVALLVISALYVGIGRLTDLNSRLASVNTELNESNSELERTGSRLRRHLYVADMAAAYRAYAQKDIDAVRQLLMRHVPGSDVDSDAKDLRGFEWKLLHNLTRTPEVVDFSGHEGPARELALIPGQRQFATVGDDGMVRVWDLDSATERFQYHLGGKLNAIAISHDGGQFVAGINDLFATNPSHVLGLASGKGLELLKRHEHSIESAAFSRDGRWVATAGRYLDVHIHQTNGEFLGTVTTDSRNESVSFSPEGGSLVAIERDPNNDEVVQYLSAWALPGLQKEKTRGFDFVPLVFAFSDEGDRVAVAGASQVVLLKWPEQSEALRRDAIRGRIRCVALDSRGHRIAVGCDNGLIHLIPTVPSSDGSEATERSIVTGEHRVTSVKFLSDQMVLATTENGTVRAWEIEPSRRTAESFGLSTRGMSAAAPHTGRVFLRGDHGGIERLEFSTVTNYEQIARVRSDGLFELAASPDGETVVASGPATLVVLSGNDGTELHRIETGSPEKRCHRLRFATDQKRLLALYHDQLMVYRTDDWSHAGQYVLNDGGMVDVALSPDPSELLLVTRNELTWLETESLQPKRHFQATLGEFCFARYSTDGDTIAVGHHDGSIELLDAASLKRLHLLRGHREEVLNLLFLDRDQTLVSSAGDGMLRFWDVESGRELGMLSVGDGDARWLHYDADRQRLYGFCTHRPTKVWSATP